jgi:FAD synthase
MINILDLQKQVNNCNTFIELIKFMEVEKKYPELNEEERKIIQDLAKARIQDLAKQNTK